MDLSVYLNNGMKFTLTGVTNYDPSTFVSSMNDPKVLGITLGNMVVNKHTITLIAPTDNLTTA